MKNQEIDKLVEATLNPYVVIKMQIFNTKEEMEAMEKLALDNGIITEKFINKYENNTIKIEINDNLSYVFIKYNFHSEFINMMKKVGYKFQFTNALNEIWTMGNINDLITKNDPDLDIRDMVVACFGEIESDKIRSILQIMVTQKYSVDDVIDLIGMGQPLNELNQYILDKESH